MTVTRRRCVLISRSVVHTLVMVHNWEQRLRGVLTLAASFGADAIHQMHPEMELSLCCPIKNRRKKNNSIWLPSRRHDGCTVCVIYSVRASIVACWKLSASLVCDLRRVRFRPNDPNEYMHRKRGFVLLSQWYSLPNENITWRPERTHFGSLMRMCECVCVVAVWPRLATSSQRIVVVVVVVVVVGWAVSIAFEVVI